MTVPTSMRTFARGTNISVVGMALACAPALAQDNFYQGQTIELHVGTAPGGLFDIAARTVARHLPRFIPGEPDMIVQNFPGGWITVVNRLYNLNEGDEGTVIVLMQRTEPLWQLQGVEEAQFVPTDFNFLGALSDYSEDAYFMAINDDHVAEDARALLDGNASARLGALNPFSSNYIFAVLAKEALGMNVEVISGYPGAAPIFMAMEQDEVDGQMVDLSALRAGQPAAWEAGNFRPVAQFGRADRLENFEDVPTGRELAQDEDTRALIEFAELPFGMTMPLAASPRIPEDRLAMLQEAFLDMAADAQFLEDAEGAGLVISPVSGDRILELLEHAAQTPQAVIDRYNEVVGVPGA